jgi:hypothetical protein
LHYSESDTRYGDITRFTQRKMTNISEKNRGYAAIRRSSRPVTADRCVGFLPQPAGRNACATISCYRMANSPRPVSSEAPAPPCIWRGGTDILVCQQPEPHTSQRAGSTVTVNSCPAASSIGNPSRKDLPVTSRFSPEPIRTSYCFSGSTVKYSGR